MLPLSYHHFNLSAVVFRDALALRYGPLLRMPACCEDVVIPQVTFCHALDCKKRGLVTQHYNEIRDALGNLVAMGFKNVLRELIVKEADD